MPRILITGFCALPGPNRAGVQMRHIVRALSRHHTVDVLVLRHGEQAYVERQGNARILRVPISEDALRGQVEAFRRALRRQLDGAEYDIVHFRDGWTGAPILEMRERLEYATVFDATRSPMAEAPMMDLELGAELGRHEADCMAQADLILVPNRAARDFATRIQGRTDRVFIVPPGVDVDQFDWDEPPSGPPVVVYAGSVEAGRGVRVLLRAMVYVNQEIEAKLIVAGHIETKFRESLGRAIQELGLQGRVDLTGEIDHDDLPALIAGATLCVAPVAPESRSQPVALFPTKLLEYMACRRAVVAPQRGTAGDLIQDGENGLLFNPGDPHDLARKILELVDNSGMRQRLARAGYELVRRNHTASGTRRGLRKAYDYLCELAPWGERISDILEEPPHARSLGPEDLSDSLSDNTDEYEPPFPADSPDEVDGVLTSTGDLTTVDPRVESRFPSPLDPPTWVTVSTDLPTQEEVVSRELADDWVVPERAGGPRNPWRSPTEADEEGTPLDIVPIHPSGDPVENRFVAGEVEVNPAPPSVAEELEEDASFTAVSVLLGNLNDDTDGAGRDEPG